MLVYLYKQQYQKWLGEVTDSGQSDSEGGSSSVVRSKLPLQNRPSQGFDYMEAVNSASSVSTPPNEPFAQDALGETVIKMDRVVTHMKQTGEGGGLTAASPLKAEGSEEPGLMV